MGRDDPDDPIEGPGWCDRLTDATVQPWQGDDRINTRQSGAAAPWHGVLCSHLLRVEGSALDELAGNIEWFYLHADQE